MFEMCGRSWSLAVQGAPCSASCKTCVARMAEIGETDWRRRRITCGSLWRCTGNKSITDVGFFHEHPVEATSWLMEEVKKLQSAAGVCTTVADQCQYGLKTRGAGGAGSMPARKRTKFMTNSSEIANELSCKCPKDHLHQALVGRRAHKAAIYPEGLCEAICRGLKREIWRSKMNVRVLTTVISTDKIGTDTSKNRSIAHEEDGESVPFWILVKCQRQG